MLGVVLGVALLARVIMAIQMGPHYYFADTEEYDAAARGILAGHGPGADYPRGPLYPALMAAAYTLFGIGNLQGVRVLQVAIGMAIVALCIRLGWRVGGRATGIVAGAAAALAPSLVFTTGLLYPTALYTLLLLGATLLASSIARRPSWGAAAALGVVMTLAWLTDQIVVAPLAGLFAWMLIAGRASGRRVFAAAAVALVVAFLLVTPWVRYRDRTYHNADIFMAKAQAVIYFARHDTTTYGNRAVRDTSSHYRTLDTGEFAKREWGLLTKQPAGYIGDWVHEFVHFFKPFPDRVTSRNEYTTEGPLILATAYYVVLFLLTGVGLFSRRVRWRDKALLLTVLLSTDAMYSFFFTQTRYRVPVEPQFIVLAAAGVLVLLPRLGERVFGAETPDPAAREPEPARSRAEARA
jgi:4-amino-4-deoxy-L-arabinose transferase-like glycosyltransferase